MCTLLPVDDPTHRYYTPNLKKCIKSAPRLVGCEAAYFFPMDTDVCLSNQTSAGDTEVLEKQPFNESHAVGAELEGEEAAAGNLVIHIRSGDIFVNPFKKYGQVGGTAR